MAALESTIHAGAALQKRGAEGFGGGAGLGNQEVEPYDRVGKGTVLEAIGVTEALLAALVGSGLEEGGALEEHGGIEKYLGEGGKALGKAVVEKGVDGVLAGGSFGLSGHGWCWFWFKHPHHPTVSGHLQSSGSGSGREAASGPLAD
jgi:hypothetical protein